MADEIMYSIVVPVFNEQEVISESYKRLKKTAEGFGEPYELVFINDGSRDKTLEILTKICTDDPASKLISFSRNFGHQVAISAGMDYAAGRAIVVIDADLQDPPEVIPKMIEKWKQGFDVVYGKRSKRKGESIFKKATASLFYRFLRSMTSVAIPVDVGDFRLIDRKVCDTMKLIREKSRFIRGLVSWVGFSQSEVEYVREERFAGVTKYPLKKMIRFAADAVSAFSYKPLKIASRLGTLSILGSIGYLAFILWKLFFMNTPAQGWEIGIIISLVLNGFTLICLGIMGGYIGRIYDESKQRPLYVVKTLVNFSDGVPSSPDKKR